MQEAQPMVTQARWSARQLAAAVAVALLSLVAISYLVYAAWPARGGNVSAASAAADEPELRRTIEDLRREVADLRVQVDALRGSNQRMEAAGRGEPAYQRPAETAAAVVPPPIAGKLERVVDTGTIMIGGRTLPLWGVRAVNDPAHVASLAKFVGDNGGNVTCDARGEQYACRTANGYDLAAVVLSNGGGRASADAPPDYKRYEQDARRRKVGIWR